MNQNNPYSTMDEERTIIRPSPGGRRYRSETSPVSPEPTEKYVDTEVLADFSMKSNVLYSSAFRLLSLVPKLRTLPYHHTIDALKERLVEEIKRFENRSMASGCTQEQVRIASYFLCSLTDETVLNTPWGSQSDWGHHGLLVHFHREAQGGEGFFHILKQLLEKPEQNIDLIELAYICLSLGFEGRHRLAANGLRLLEQQRQELYALIRRVKGGSEGELSVRWKGLQDIRSSLMRNVPLWVAMTTAGLLLLIIYIAFVYRINSESNAVYRQLSVIAQNQLKKPRPDELISTIPLAMPQKTAANISTDLPTRVERYRALLAAEIAQNRIKVLDGPTLRITGAFPSGREVIKKEFLPVLEKIAKCLQEDRVFILVVGHTDDTPIFSPRFQSNWHLSDARAKSVAGILASKAALGKRIRYEGRGDTEPIVSNKTPENRALNRRIDIHVRGQGAMKSQISDLEKPG